MYIRIYCTRKYVAKSSRLGNYRSEVISVDHVKSGDLIILRDKEGETVPRYLFIAIIYWKILQISKVHIFYECCGYGTATTTHHQYIEIGTTLTSHI